MEIEYIILWAILFLAGVAFAYMVWSAIRYCREMNGFRNNRQEGRLENIK